MFRDSYSNGWKNLLYDEYDDDDYYYDEEYYDDDYDDEEVDSTHRKKNTMIFIDAESVSADHCPRIIGQGKAVGEISEIRYYARQNDQTTAAWKDYAKRYDIKPILMYGEAEHNKIDNKIIKDIRNIYRTNKSIDIFCIVSRDGDFTEIVNEMRGLKKRVVVFATKNTSEKLRNAASEVKGI